MADLVKLLGKLGHTEVKTLLNSGNAVFTAETAATAVLAARIRQAVLAKLGVDALVIVKALASAKWGDEKIHVGKHAAYLWCANGILGSRAAVALLKGLEGKGTTRNWATLNKIHALTAQGN